MDNFDISYLQASAIDIVQRFLDGEGSLDSLISSYATKDELNSEQIKRVIEAVNTLAFLKKLQVEKDRTTEFPVASFEGVMNCLTPQPVVIKEAALSEKELVKYKTLAKRKKEQRLSQEQEAMLKKAFWQTSLEVERDFPEYVDNVHKVISLRDKLRVETNFFHKVAALPENEVTKAFVEFVGLPLEKTAGVLLKDKDLTFVKEAYETYKKAYEFQDAYQEKVFFLSECLEKQAGLFEALGSGVRNLITKPIISMGSKVARGLADKGLAAKNSVAAGIYKMRTGEANPISHLANPANAAEAAKHGFNQEAYLAGQLKPKRLLTPGRVAGGAIALGAAMGMKHKQDTDLNNI